MKLKVGGSIFISQADGKDKQGYDEYMVGKGGVWAEWSGTFWLGCPFTEPGPWHAVPLNSTRHRWFTREFKKRIVMSENSRLIGLTNIDCIAEQLIAVGTMK